MKLTMPFLLLIVLAPPGTLSSSLMAQVGLRPVGQRARVVWANGSQQDVTDFRFVYRWRYRSQNGYINTPVRETKSVEFHYSETARNVVLDRHVPAQRIRRLLVVWKSDELYPDSLVFTLDDSRFVRLSVAALAPASSFLENTPAESVTDDALLSAVLIEGVVSVQGQSGTFRASLFPISRGTLHPDDPISEVIFEAPRR